MTPPKMVTISCPICIAISTTYMYDVQYPSHTYPPLVLPPDDASSSDCSHRTVAESLTCICVTTQYCSAAHQLSRQRSQSLLRSLSFIWLPCASPHHRCLYLARGKTRELCASSPTKLPFEVVSTDVEGDVQGL
jgi:hypothetical protein